MNEFFGKAYSQEDLLRRRHSHRGSQSHQNGLAQEMAMASSEQQGRTDAGNIDLVGGDTLDDIIMQNNNEIQRRQSLSQAYVGQPDIRRQSMLDFSSTTPDMNSFQFESPVMVSDEMLRRQSMGELDMNGGFSEMSSSMHMGGQQMGYSQGPPSSLTIDTSINYTGLSGDMQGMIDYSSVRGIDGLSEEDSNAMSLFSTFPYSNDMDAMSANFMIGSNLQDTNISNHGTMVSNIEEGRNIVSGIPSVANLNVRSNSFESSPPNYSMKQNLPQFNGPATSDSPSTNDLSNSMTPAAPSITETTSTETLVDTKKEKNHNYQGIYSQSGFDMLGALMKVATRKNPEIDIGKVDMSCAFVVCDIALDDCPIIYVSDIFERLTGYTKHEVLGRNCRFLQSPEGIVQSGAHREFVDNNSVFYLKNKISANKEAQRSLINYRKGGQPFMNLLTMIPITGEDDKEIRYFVGFQVDLVEKPTSVAGKNASGLYTVDYSQGTLPRYIWQPPEVNRVQDGGQTIGRDDVAAIINGINNPNETEFVRQTWAKALLENTDDVVHVLSLKGLFLYLSPSSRKVLEYDSSELVGTALSSICHPSDIVPVTRELKDSSTGSAVNVVFRIRRKKSGYTWFESHGTLCVEQGKGRKCIILVGRERPVYALSRSEIEDAGGIGEAEMWTKVSTSGMFLFVSSNVRNLLDRSPEDLIGTSIQSLMRAESRKEFNRALEQARTGKRVTHKHEILNKRGLVLQSQTTLHPGDASEGQKPTFLVAQTRLLKTTRAVPTGQSSPTSTKALTNVVRSPNTLSIDPQPFSPSVTSQIAPSQSIGSPSTITRAGGIGLVIGSQDLALASEHNIFDELKTTRCTSWQFELRQMEKSNRLLAEELAALISAKKKRKRRRPGHIQRDCANCHTHVTPEWRRGPSGQRDLCNSCGLRWAKQTGRVSPRTSSKGGTTVAGSVTAGGGGFENSKTAAQKSNSASPVQNSPLSKEFQALSHSTTPNLNTNEEVQGDIKGEKSDVGPEGGSTAIPGVLGGRSTADSMPVHEPSIGFRDGGERGITLIEEEDGEEGDDTDLRRTGLSAINGKIRKGSNNFGEAVRKASVGIGD